MKRLGYLIARNCKIYFRDKGVFFTSMIAPLILLFLYIAFLGGTIGSSVEEIADEFKITVDEGAVAGFTGGWVLSSLIAVCAVSIAFTANTIMIQDRVTGKRDDFLVSPLPRHLLALGYYISTAIVTLAVSFTALFVGFIYLAAVGWYLSAADVFLLMLDTVLLTLFGTALSSFLCSMLRSQGSIAAVQVIVSAAYGFLCGAYMPIDSLASGIRNFIMLLPGTYGTALLHSGFMGGAIDAMSGNEEFRSALKNAFDCKLEFFGSEVPTYVCYLVVIIAIALFVGAYVLVCVLEGKKKTRNPSYGIKSEEKI